MWGPELICLALVLGPLTPPDGMAPLVGDLRKPTRFFDPDAVNPRRSIQHWLDQESSGIAPATPLKPQPSARLLGRGKRLNSRGPLVSLPNHLVTAALSGQAFPVGSSEQFALFPFPLIGVSSDDGVGFGAVVAFFYTDGTDPYRFSAVANGYETTLGTADDFINFDWLDAFGTRFRVATEVRYRNENNASFFGSGNQSPPVVEGLAGSHYTYGKATPAVHGVLRHDINARWFWYLSYLFEDAFIRVYPGSVVAEQLPIGSQGGVNAPLTLGVAYDTRDSEVWTTRGSFDEFSLRGASVLTGSSFTWGGGTVIFRHFWTLPFELVIADQLLIDVQSGNIPFYDLDTTGTLAETEGLGGQNSLRGFVKDRFLGDVKLMDNLELRKIVYSLDSFGHRIHLGVVAFAEAGRVYDHVVENGAFLTDGPPLLIHWDVGLGPRFVFEDSFLVRFDVGASVEGLGYYLTFRNLF